MDHHEKLAWSAQHLHALDLEIKEFVKKHPFTARGEQDGDSRRFNIIANEYPLLPSHWPLMVGDAVHNMRSALDHIVWALTERFSARYPEGSAARPTYEESFKIQYPICDTPGRYFGTKKGKWKDGQRFRCARFVGPDAITVIDTTQPHLRGKDAYPHPLSVLAKFSNEDKHRKLFASGVLASEIQFSFSLTATTRQDRLGRFDWRPTGTQLYSNAHLGVLEFDEGTTCDPGEMVVQAELTGTIAFAKEGYGQMLVVWALEKLLDAIHEDIVVPLDAVLFR
jgi:hypothetical protein